MKKQEKTPVSLDEAQQLAKEKLDTAKEDATTQTAPAQEGTQSPAEEQSLPAEEAARIVAQNRQLTMQNRQLIEALQEQAALIQKTAQQQALEPTRQQEEQQAQTAQEEISSPEDFIDALYTDPVGTVTHIVEKALQKQGVTSALEQLSREQEGSKAKQEWTEAAQRLLQDAGRFPRFRELSAAINQIIGSNPAFQEGNKVQNLMNAYYIAVGMQPGNAGTEGQPADEDALLKAVQGNPELLKRLTLMQAKNKESTRQVPPLSASSGAVSAVPNLYNEPRSIDAADVLARKKLGL